MFSQVLEHFDQMLRAQIYPTIKFGLGFEPKLILSVAKQWIPNI